MRKIDLSFSLTKKKTYFETRVTINAQCNVIEFYFLDTTANIKNNT